MGWNTCLQPALYPYTWTIYVSVVDGLDLVLVCIFCSIIFTFLNTAHLSFHVYCLSSFCCSCSELINKYFYFYTFNSWIFYFSHPLNQDITHITKEKVQSSQAICAVAFAIVPDFARYFKIVCKLNTYCNCAHNLEKLHEHNKAFATLPVWLWNKEGLCKCDSKESSLQPLVN